MHTLIGLHAVLGEVGALAFLWVLVELLNPNESRLRRARIAALLGILFLAGAWFFGGFYYVTEYGAAVKPIIKSGPIPWAHSIITETKEHVFLFLPFLAILTWGLLKRYQNEFIQKRNFRMTVLLISGLVVLLAFAMAGMGFLISSGFRAALESKII
ncbi:hypothetical protein A3D68_00085 [Candidatus Adlerbacteria bacterium RIFCSPHIGHO2_02_FULL_52_17]|uniref:DUF2231 domain-containing protein n=1 Tax=Candidatus Adlerbacteria bacterium RIFCSPHIGHO2_02_FULL_52_17 TaxID=1797240 RepID=A0A1F4XQW2_9BACT|nr:MAG: hypothetical protein A3D68_00085 [Candidatus Adlerbacteria bacterium RIFCSPHIGHO2_02_FULL_52_17]